MQLSKSINIHFITYFSIKSFLCIYKFTRIYKFLTDSGDMVRLKQEIKSRATDLKLSHTHTHTHTHTQSSLS